MKNSKAATISPKFIERNQMFEFLIGLNMQYNQIRIQLLGKESLTSLNEAFSIIRAKEGRWRVMSGPPTSEGSAFVVLGS